MGGKGCCRWNAASPSVWPAAVVGVLVTVLSPAAIGMFAFRGAKAGWHPRRSGSCRLGIPPRAKHVSFWGKPQPDVTGTVTNSWTYDLNGNRLTEAKTGAATVYYAYNAADQLCWYASTTGTCAAPPPPAPPEPRPTTPSTSSPPTPAAQQ